jgi:hypothetical protein
VLFSNMSGLLSVTYEKWKAHPRRYDVPFLIQTSYRQYLDRRYEEKERRRMLVPPINPINVEVLADEEFRASIAAVRGKTLLDVGRLANLWCVARQAGPGVYLEVGSYRGGGALHICNAVREKSPRFYSFDPFEDGGFESIRPEDETFDKDQFTETSYRDVVRLLSPHPNASVRKGFSRPPRRTWIFNPSPFATWTWMSTKRRAIASPLSRLAWVPRAISCSTM